jgi:DNA-binding MarR family transcriptional regulator
LIIRYFKLSSTPNSKSFRTGDYKNHKNFVDGSIGWSIITPTHIIFGNANCRRDQNLHTQRRGKAGGLYHVLSKELNKGSVSYAQFFLLGYLANENYLTMTDISKKMGHSTAAATGLVDRLEKLGYVQRLHASEDRRKVMVQITRKGIDLVERIREDITSSLVSLMVDLDQNEQEALLKTYGKISTYVRSN